MKLKVENQSPETATIPKGMVVARAFAVNSNDVERMTLLKEPLSRDRDHEGGRKTRSGVRKVRRNAWIEMRETRKLHLRNHHRRTPANTRTRCPSSARPRLDNLGPRAVSECSTCCTRSRTSSRITPPFSVSLKVGWWSYLGKTRLLRHMLAKHRDSAAHVRYPHGHHQ